MPDRAHSAVGHFLWSNPMTQYELNQEIATQTGESLHTIRSMGFGLLQPVIPIEERQEPLMMDWDEHERIRNLRGTF